MSELTIDCNIPSGNIILDGIDGDTVKIRQDMRDSADWFYWAFRVKGAQGRTLKFLFTDPYAEGPVSVRGPAVTKDGGKTWSYAAEASATTNSFSYTFADNEEEVWFYQTFQYFPPQWDEFLAKHEADRGKIFAAGELCKTRKGRSVPNALFGRIDGHAKYRIFLSSRHHCQEAPATYVLEGIVSRVFAKDAVGDWLRENVEFITVPFVDYDGVVDGDQGKGRKPHDHNRDYNHFIYPETRAITEWVAKIVDNDLTVFLDLHSPWVRNEWNERVYITYGPDEKVNAAKKRLGEIIERVQRGSLGYKVADNFPWNFGWNCPSNVATGLKGAGGWAGAAAKNALLVGSFEIPFAKANDKVVTPTACREFGEDIAAALKEFIETKNC